MPGHNRAWLRAFLPQFRLRMIHTRLPWIQKKLSLKLNASQCPIFFGCHLVSDRKGFCEMILLYAVDAASTHSKKAPSIFTRNSRCSTKSVWLFWSELLAESRFSQTGTKPKSLPVGVNISTEHLRACHKIHRIFCEKRINTMMFQTIAWALFVNAIWKFAEWTFPHTMSEIVSETCGWSRLQNTRTRIADHDLVSSFPVAPKQWVSCWSNL